MADLALVTAATLHVVDADVHAQLTVPAAAAIVAGQPCILDTAGKAALADADVQTVKSQVFIALRNAAAGEAVTLSKSCVIDGYDLSGMAFNDPIYLSNTAGAFGTTAGTTSLVVGRVESVFANGATADKLFRFFTLA